VRSLVDLEGASPGYWSRNARQGSLALAAPAPTTEWEAHRTFKTVVRGVTAEAPQVSGRQVTFLDLDGDGFADLVSLEGNRISWWPSRGRDGYGPHGYDLTTSTDERRGPTWVHPTEKHVVVFADMTGDGLADAVRIENGRVTYWPNVGRGRFGPAVVMRGAPVFDSPEKFDARRVKVGDSDGTGTTDLLYVDGSRTRLWRNHAGNGFAQAVEIPLPALDGQSTTDFVDLLGTGTGPRPRPRRQWIREAGGWAVIRPPWMPSRWHQLHKAATLAASSPPPWAWKRRWCGVTSRREHTGELHW
jgi:hypothetical protein